MQTKAPLAFMSVGNTGGYRLTSEREENFGSVESATIRGRGVECDF